MDPSCTPDSQEQWKEWMGFQRFEDFCSRIAQREMGGDGQPFIRKLVVIFSKYARSAFISSDSASLSCEKFPRHPAVRHMHQQSRELSRASPVP